jgi:hypothetical protein
VSVTALEVCVTTWLRMGDVLGRLFASPRYRAVSGQESALKFDLVRVATPLALSVAVPMKYPAHEKLIFPVGGSGPVVVTFAVQVTV